jgi:hypothetical protein
MPKAGKNGKAKMLRRARQGADRPRPPKKADKQNDKRQD